jgi:ATP-dependent Clp protease ATP-binding subunit ClpA
MLSRTLEQTLHTALEFAGLLRHEYATLEHLLVALVDDTDAAATLRASGADPQALRQDLIRFLENDLQDLVTGYPAIRSPRRRISDKAIR